MLPSFVENILFIGLIANLSAKFNSQIQHLIGICCAWKVAIFAVVVLDFLYYTTSGTVPGMHFFSKIKKEFTSEGKVFLNKGDFFTL